MAKGRPGVMIYFETGRAVKWLDYESKGRLFEAIMEYAENGTAPQFEGHLAVAWPFIAEKIDRDGERYEDIRKARAEAGRKGGKSRAENIKQMQTNEANAKFDKQNEQNKPTTTATPTVTPSATYKGNKADKEREGMFSDENTSASEAPPLDPPLTGAAERVYRAAMKSGMSHDEAMALISRKKESKDGDGA